ncbi:MAG: hypothetical protein K0S47_3340 [Herbinix sp.]|jgi:hypothetical protein|nr:hypothetical protein [Herbinix sp.]
MLVLYCIKVAKSPECTNGGSPLQIAGTSYSNIYTIACNFGGITLGYFYILMYNDIEVNSLFLETAIERFSYTVTNMNFEG